MRISTYILTTLLTSLFSLFGCAYNGTSNQITVSEDNNKLTVQHKKYAIPPHSDLHLAASNELDHLLFFAGKTEIRARYDFIYERNSERTSNPYLIIYPDEQSLALLPYLPEIGSDGLPSAIYIQNTEEVARLMFNKLYLSKLNSGLFPIVSGEASFVIQEYWMGYECDRPAFAARIASVKKIET